MSQETMQGVLCMQKPAEFTSFDVIGKLRGILHMRRLAYRNAGSYGNRCAAGAGGKGSPCL